MRAAALLAVAALLAATACGPLAVGGGGRYDYEAGRTYPVTAGESVTVEARWSLDEAGVSRSALDGRNPAWIPSGARGDSANAITWVSLVEASLPEGWELDLRQIRVHRERALGDRGDDASYAHDLRATLRVTAPSNAAGLTRRVRAALAVRNGDRLPIDFLVEAR